MFTYVCVCVRVCVFCCSCYTHTSVRVGVRIFGGHISASLDSYMYSVLQCVDAHTSVRFGVRIYDGKGGGAGCLCAMGMRVWVCV